MVLKNCEDIQCIHDDNSKVAPPKIEVWLLMYGKITLTENTLCSHLGLRQERDKRYEKNQNSYQSSSFSFTSEIAASTFPTLGRKINVH